MRDALRYYLINYPVLWIAPVVVLALIILPFVENTGSLRQQLAQRWLESEGRTPAQMQARQDAERQAAEQRTRQAQAEAAQRAEAQRAEASRQDAQARQQAQEQERQRAQEQDKQRQAAGFARLLAEWRARSGPVLDKGELMAGGAKGATNRLEETPQWLGQFGITRADIVNRQNCTPGETPLQAAYSPSSFSTQILTDRQLGACVFYLHGASYSIGSDVSATLIAETLLRLFVPSLRPDYPIQAMFAYAQVAQWEESLLRGRPLLPLADLTDNRRINPALFTSALPLPFASRLIDTATPEERATIERESYPAMKQLFEIASRLLAACKAAGKIGCLAG